LITASLISIKPWNKNIHHGSGDKKRLSVYFILVMLSLFCEGMTCYFNCRGLNNHCASGKDCSGSLMLQTSVTAVVQGQPEKAPCTTLPEQEFAVATTNVKPARQQKKSLFIYLKEEGSGLFYNFS